MQIDLAQVRGEPLHWQERKVVPAGDLEREDLVALSEIDWRGRVSFAESGFYFTAHLEYEQTLVCTRCLSSYSEPVSAEVELLLVLDEAAASGRHTAVGDEEGELELEEEDLGIVQVSAERFDVEPILTEQLQLNVPMKPLCRPDCKGLCPTCGADLNAGACGCSGAPADPRWEALEGLRERLSGKE